MDSVHPGHCYHCGLLNNAENPIQIQWEGKDRSFCCMGCRAAFELIHAAGLAAFYRQRDTMNAGRPEELTSREWNLLSSTVFQAHHVRPTPDGLAETDLLLGGIHCAACVWLNEQVLQRLPGVVYARVNFSTHRALVRWRPEETSMADIIVAIRRIGYRADPFDSTRLPSRFRQQSRDILLRLGVAGFGAGNIMIMAVALYAGYFQGMASQHKQFLHLVSWLVATPVMLYSGWPFFRGAWSGLRLGHLTMDLPITLGCLITYGYSVSVLLLGRGEIYFDSVCTFLFFLLIGRYLEFSARRKSSQVTERLLQLEPVQTTLLGEEGPVVVPVTSVVAGDQLLIRPGERFPVDGIILTGTTATDDSPLTGESLPISRGPDDPVLAGATNIDGTVTIRATGVGGNTTLARMARLVEAAQNERPPLQTLADQVARRFVAGILVLAAATLLYWWPRDAEQAWQYVVALLIITCPCALGLATPVAFAVASGAAAQLGILIKQGGALELLAKADLVILDKTGTLTLGQPQVTALHPQPGVSAERLLTLAALAEQGSEHPIARAIVNRAHAENISLSQESPVTLRNHPGLGVEVTCREGVLRTGSRAFLSRALGKEQPEPNQDSHITWAGCSLDQEMLGWIALTDTLKPDARATVEQLRHMGLTVWLLSGDRDPVVQRVGEEVGVDRAMGNRLPEDKERVVQQQIAAGQCVVMVGDGLNDAPAMARASVGITVEQAADLSVSASGVVLLNPRLSSLTVLIQLARRTFRIIRQNFALSILYNALAIPLAVTGHVVPVVAAIAMPLSSLAVVINALRLRRITP
ncbi:MAG: heavy metal translocating P-type ATPase [Magnetococcales bacterium]|nr:heavy metal translocating P-type ATPase [Magnetococcales bacterium]